MRDEQLQCIVGLFAGVQTALVHMATVLDAKGVVSRDELADSFLKTVAGLPSETNNKELISLVLTQVAQGIAASTAATPPEYPQGPLLRLIKGGKSSAQ